ncbi:hypothetical protein [Amphritea sp. HPY]|uniref:hypothetical protein n=1 Tax=Amphritea sp. HPY TaxID=3421652 RepID=UPI003D7C9178
MTDPVRLKVFHLDNCAQQTLSLLFEQRLDEFWVGGLQACFGQDLFRASWLRIRLDDEHWIEIGVQRHEFKDGFSVGSLNVATIADTLPAPENTSWVALPAAATVSSIDIYEQRELIDVVAPDLNIPAESLNYDALLVLKLNNGSAIMLGMEQDFIDGELVMLQTDSPENQIGEALKLRRSLKAEEQ